MILLAKIVKTFLKERKGLHIMSGVTKRLLNQQKPRVIELTDKELERVNGSWMFPISSSTALSVTNVAFAAPGTALAVSAVSFANNNSGF